jgi:4-diphosphocytidyl-2-C-methyl-D-erythritol kinase
LQPLAKGRAAAKVNLALHVTGRRADGYHTLDSIAVFADHGDDVEIAGGALLRLAVSGPFGDHAPGDRSDLAWRAASAFFTHTGMEPEATIRLHKEIPAGAGLGGGSADAAAVLLALNRAFGASLKPSALESLARRLGADVPMCLVGRALRARGAGDEIAPLENWPPLPLVLVWPGVPVSTAEVYAALAERENPPLPDLPAIASPDAVAAWLGTCRNDLEAPALTLAPVIGDVLAALREADGCRLARMSGSGSACFGLYGEKPAADAAAAAIAAAHPTWWVQAVIAA